MTDTKRIAIIGSGDVGYSELTKALVAEANSLGIEVVHLTVGELDLGRNLIGIIEDESANIGGSFAVQGTVKIEDKETLRELRRMSHEIKAIDEFRANPIDETFYPRAKHRKKGHERPSKYHR